MHHHSKALNVRTTLKNGLAQLRDAHVPSYTLAAELLLLHVLGRDRTWIYSHPEEEISDAVAQRFFALVARHSVSDQTHFVESNLLDQVATLRAQHAAPVRGKDSPDESPITSHQSPLFDLIASNPPYIGRREAATLMPEVRDHEPEIALYGGEEGYELYADLITEAAAHLKPGGILVLELGHNSWGATAGGAAFTLTVNGGNFINGSVVQWNGSARTTTFVSTSQLTATIPASDIATGGTPQVTVFNPAPGGGTSGALTFTINNPVPTTTSISPSSE